MTDMADVADPVLGFYESLADEYRLIFADWDASVRYQAEVLEKLLRELGAPPDRTLLDCAAGVGTQAIGLAQRGYRVTATDLSPGLLAQLRREASNRKLDIPSHVADLRTLDATLQARFDAAIAMDNVLPHLPTEQDITRAASQIRARLRPGGAFITSVRDYDALRAQRPRFDPQRGMVTPDGRRITFQVWDWAEDGSQYTLKQFVLQEREDGRWETHCHPGVYRAVGRDELERALRAAGLSDVQWRPPDATGYYQPILTARAPT